MPIIIYKAYELLAQNGVAYIQPDSIYYRDHLYNIWIDINSSANPEPSDKYNISIKYSGYPAGLYMMPLSDEALKQANDTLLDMKKTVHYDLVGYHIERKTGLMLPVVSAFYGGDTQMVIPLLSSYPKQIDPA